MTPTCLFARPTQATQPLTAARRPPAPWRGLTHQQERETGGARFQRRMRSEE
ncbi:hypothetical protein E2C01_076841 [Portunus trituberculatus]|uniref:Uncharacterized protein n=1 Tax=Portunus trituberculatus TaxID=210409 RepID=A0A5B7IPR7_PORTR|nr:hypothetical protein [Portunus trituberculatus]